MYVTITSHVGSSAARVEHGDDVGVAGAGPHLDVALVHHPVHTGGELEPGHLVRLVSGPEPQQEELHTSPIHHLSDVPRHPGGKNKT